MRGSSELVQAGAEQKAARDRVTHAAWGDRLSLEQYLERERRLRAHPWAAKEMTTWLLVNGGLVMASCETFRMDSRLLRSDQRLRGDTWAVASVFVEAEYRGRGLATEMMDLLVKRLRQEKNAQAVILFSDVGEGIYERSGFSAIRSREWVLPADRSAEIPETVTLVSEGELSKVLDAAAEVVPADPFLVWPTADQLGWHLERERCYAELLGRTRPRACGARSGVQQGLLWMADFKENVLRVILAGLPVPLKYIAPALLLRAAQRIAAEAGLEEVIIWDEPWDFVGDTALPAKLRERTSSIPMICPLTEMAPGSWKRAPRSLWV